MATERIDADVEMVDVEENETEAAVAQEKERNQFFASSSDKLYGSNPCYDLLVVLNTILEAYDAIRDNVRLETYKRSMEAVVARGQDFINFMETRHASLPDKTYHEIAKIYDMNEGNIEHTYLVMKVVAFLRQEPPMNDVAAGRLIGDVKKELETTRSIQEKLREVHDSEKARKCLNNMFQDKWVFHKLRLSFEALQEISRELLKEFGKYDLIATSQTVSGNISMPERLPLVSSAPADEQQANIPTPMGVQVSEDNADSARSNYQASPEQISERVELLANDKFKSILSDVPGGRAYVHDYFRAKDCPGIFDYCFFEAFSFALFGNFARAEELRVRTIVELLLNSQKYGEKWTGSRGLAPQYEVSFAAMSAARPFIPVPLDFIAPLAQLLDCGVYIWQVQSSSANKQLEIARDLDHTVRSCMGNKVQLLLCNLRDLLSGQCTTPNNHIVCLLPVASEAEAEAEAVPDSYWTTWDKTALPAQSIKLAPLPHVKSFGSSSDKLQQVELNAQSTSANAATQTEKTATLTACGSTPIFEMTCEATCGDAQSEGLWSDRLILAASEILNQPGCKFDRQVVEEVQNWLIQSAESAHPAVKHCLLNTAKSMEQFSLDASDNMQVATPDLSLHDLAQLVH